MNALAQVEPLVDVNEAAKLLNRSKRTVLRLAQKRVIPAAKVGKVWRFRLSRLNEWLDAQMKDGAA